jgi:hypothetical protein
VKITIESTTKIVKIVGSSRAGLVDAIECRVWEGVTEHGIKVQCLIPRIAAANGQDISQFVAELQEQRAPSAEVSAFPARMIL